MFETIAKILGTTFTTAGVSLQALTIGSDKPTLVVQIVAIACSAIGAGCLAVTGKLVGSKQEKSSNEQ